MKKILIFFPFIISIGVSYAQEYFINEDFIKGGKIKFDIPFTPDWTKDFFIEAKIRVAITENPSAENGGLVFGFDEKTKSFYGIYIQNSSKQIKQYLDYFLLKSQNTSETFDNNVEWQRTSLVNHHDFNRLQIHKIDNELFFGINDQVVAYISNIESKGSLLKLVTGNTGISAKYVKAQYLSGTDHSVLKAQLKEQLELYNKTKIHNKIANDYPKVLDLEQPAKIPDAYYRGSSYHPELGYLEAGGILYDLDTFKVTSFQDILAKNTNTVFRNNNYRTVELIIPNQPVKTLDDYQYIGELNDSELLLVNRKHRVFSYNYKTQSFKKLFKIKGNISIFLSTNKRFLCIENHVYSIPDGKEVEYKIPESNYRGKIILSCFDDYIILEINDFRRYKVNLITGESELITKEGTFQKQYLIETVGRELNITDLSANTPIVEHLQLLARDTETHEIEEITYYPERNEVYVNISASVEPGYYFSYEDAVQNTSSYVVNTKTNEITPFLLYKTAAAIQKNNEENAAKKAQAKREVDQFFSQLKTFGSSYTLNYNSFDYVNVSHDPLLNKLGVGGTIYAIGKFCSYDGGSFLALRITNDQYVVERIAVTYGYDGQIYVRRYQLGITQKVNGVTTQVAEVSVRRNVQDKTQYTLTVNDGKNTVENLTSDCN